MSLPDTLKQPHPVMLLAYRALVGVAMIAIPTLLTYQLSQSQAEAAKIDAVVISNASLVESFRRHEQNIGRRVTSLEDELKARGVNVMTHHDFERERAILDERFIRLLEKVDQNTETVRTLVEKVDDLCDAVDGCG